MDYTDFEISIYQYRDEYYVLFRFSMTGGDEDIPVISDRPVEVIFNFDQLRKASFAPKNYGRCLTEMLFADQSLRSAYGKAKVRSADKKCLRFRLHIDPSAIQLHGLRWEMLLDPETYLPLATDENVIFSRFLTSPYWGQVELKQKGDLHALVAIASPADCESRIDVIEELRRAKEGLEGIEFQKLPEEGHCATLENILDVLRSQPGIDILYLVCHGMMKQGQPYLFLENEQGDMDWVSGKTLALCMQQIQNRPRLVVLVSCQSAGSGTGDALAALGPRLADIGIPAVIAMQDDFSFETAARFFPIFFRELQRDGQIDRAMAAARGAVRERFDAWVPVLFMRLKSGRLWYVPGFSNDHRGFEKFPSQIRNIKRGRCTPILGPGLVEPILGSLREIARRWADDFHYPMEPHECESLPQVAQFLTIDQDAMFPFDDLEASLIGRIHKTFKNGQTDGQADNSSIRHNLNHLIEQVGANLRKKQALEPHKVLAGLPLPIYLTANQDYLLEAALREVGKDPQTFLCPWNQYIKKAKTVYDLEPNYEPTSKRPIVFHLFGTWDQPDSVVLTEDQYFDFLIGVTSNKNLIPEQVREALINNSLLILGFRIEEWDFRVIFRSLLMPPGVNRRHLFSHIAAQLEPEDGRILEPLRARLYLEQYFQKSSIDIYWGCPEEFMAELMVHLNKSDQEVLS